MKKTKIKKTPLSKIKEGIKPQNEIVSTLPQSIVYIIFIGWFIFVFSEYFSKFSPAVFGGFFANYPALSVSKLFPRIYEGLLNIIVAFAIILSGFAIGDILTKKIQKGIFFKEISFLEKFVFSAALGLGVLVFVTFSLGLAGLLNKTFFIILVLILSAVGVLSIFSSLSAIKISSFSLTEKIGVLLIAYIAFFNALGALTPETFYDSQFYQLGIPAKWLLEGKITSNIYMPPSFFPFNVNILYMIAMMVNNEITVKVLHWLFGLLMAFAVYTFGKKYFSRKVGVFAALIFYSAIPVMLVSWKSAVELGIGFFEFATVFALVNFFANNEKKWLVLSGVFCGFSLGSKYTSIAFSFLPAMLTIFLWGIAKKDKVSIILKNTFIFTATALLVCSPWYIRNIVHSGNPVFPFFWQKIGFLTVRAAEGALLSDPAAPQFTFLNYFGFLWPLTMGTLQQESYLGVLFLSFLPFLFLFKKIDDKIVFLILYTFLCILFWAILGRYYLRYFIPTLPVVGIIYAYYLVNQNTSMYFKNLLFLLVFYIVFNNVNFASNILKHTQDPIGYVSGMQTKKEYLSTQRPGYPAPYYQTLNWANRNLPKEAKIIFLGETRGLFSERIFYTSGAGDYSPFIERLKRASGSDELYSLFQNDGITHILLNIPEAKRLASYDIFYFEENDLNIFNDFWRKHVREVYRDIADIYLPQHGIASMKRQQPEWWAGYFADPKNHVYLYEILAEDEAKSKPPPFNFLLLEEFYTKKRWQNLRGTAGILSRGNK